MATSIFKTTAFFILTILLLNLANTQEIDCTGRWIYIRKLPSRFNLDLLSKCSSYPLYGSFCPYITNHGLGFKTHNRSQSWYRTDPLMLEVIYHRRILEYPCLTSDPLESNAVFVPYYAAIDSIRYLYGDDYNSSSEHGLELYKFLREVHPHIWKRHSGHDHFLVMSRPAWDFSQPVSNDPPLWGTSFLVIEEFYNVTVLTAESRAWPWQEQAVPYPTSFHPQSGALLESWVRRVRRSRRTALMLFAGGGGSSSTPNIRRSIRLECENATSTNSSLSSNLNDNYDGFYYSSVCDFVDCSNSVCEHDPIRFMKPMLGASFCLQPPGDTPTRRSTFDTILAGCIPVFFEGLSAKLQYGWHLPKEEYGEFSVYIPKEDVVYKGLRIVDVLKSIPRHQVRKMREKVIELIPRVIYRKHGSEIGVKDAFDVAIDGTLQRIKHRLEEVSFSSH